MTNVPALILGCLLLLLASLALAGPEKAAPAQQSVEDTYAALQADTAYQKQFLEPPAPPKPLKTARWLQRLLHGLSFLLRWVFWIGVAVVVAGFLYFLIRELLWL